MPRWASSALLERGDATAGAPRRDSVLHPLVKYLSQPDQVDAKPRVENQVAYVRESWFDGEPFTGLDDARESAEHWCREIGGARVHGTTRQIPRELYDTEEKPSMLPPPTEPFDVPLWTEAKVHPEGSS